MHDVLNFDPPQNLKDLPFNFFNPATIAFKVKKTEPLHEKTNNLHMRKQRRSNCTADQRLCFRHMDSTIYIQSFKLLA